MRNQAILMAAILALTGELAFQPIGFAKDFHINAQSDSLSDKEAKQYIGSSIGSVTQVLGSPSMVRNNRGDETKIDYIYIGNGKVYTFEVLKEGKEVTGYKKDSRGSWEGGVYPAYPPKKAA